MHTLLDQVSAEALKEMMLNRVSLVVKAKPHVVGMDNHADANFSRTHGDIMPQLRPFNDIFDMESAGQRQALPPAAGRATALSSFTSAPPCADPRCSISRDPRRDEYAICTA